MTILEEFAANVKRLFVKPEGKIERAVHASMGIAGEAGEIIDSVKKTWIYGKEIDTANILEECGDSLFYIQALLAEYGFSIEDALQHNISKLNLRYPVGYSDAAAIERKDKQPNAQPQFYSDDAARTRTLKRIVGRDMVTEAVRKDKQ